MRNGEINVAKACERLGRKVKGDKEHRTRVNWRYTDGYGMLLTDVTGFTMPMLIPPTTR